MEELLKVWPPQNVPDPPTKLKMTRPLDQINSTCSTWICEGGLVAKESKWRWALGWGHLDLEFSNLKEKTRQNLEKMTSSRHVAYHLDPTHRASRPASMSWRDGERERFRFKDFFSARFWCFACRTEPSFMLLKGFIATLQDWSHARIRENRAVRLVRPKLLDESAARFDSNVCGFQTTISRPHWLPL